MSASGPVHSRLTRTGYELLAGPAVVVRVREGREGGTEVVHVPAGSTRTLADPVAADSLAWRIARLHAA